MFHMTHTHKSVLGMIILALTTTFGTMSAQASLISYNAFATAQPGQGDTDFDITFFLDTADIPLTGTATVIFSSVDVIFNGAFTGGMDQSFTYTNTETGTQSFFGTIQLVPFNAKVNAAGEIVGIISGVQTGPGGLCVARVSMGNNVPLGQVIDARFFGCADTKFNAELDLAVFNSISGPTAVIPLPAALPLFGSALALLLMIGRRRKR